MRFLILATALALTPLDSGGPPPGAGPHFNGDRLVQPSGYDEWPLVGASLGLSYERADSAPGTFHRVYMSPAAYATFKRTHAFPEGTIFVLRSYQPEERRSIAKGGWVEGDTVGLSASVKDARFPGGWAYFDFRNGAAADAATFPDTRCHACHQAHGAIDSVFAQFYPNLR